MQQLSWTYSLRFLFFSLFWSISKAEDDREAAGGESWPNQDNSVFFKNNPISTGFTTRWKDQFIALIFVGTPSHFYELQLDLYVAGMWLFDVSCMSSGQCGNVNGKDLFNRRNSLTLQDLNRPVFIGQSVTGDYVADNVSISYFLSYRQKFALATHVPFESPQSGVFGLGLEIGNLDIPIRVMLRKTVQPSVTILADRSNQTRTENTRSEGSLTVGRLDTVNCKNDLQFVPLYDSSAWIVKLIRVSTDGFIDRSTPLVAFRPGVSFTYAPRSFTEIFYYKLGAKPVGNGTFWGLRREAGFTPLHLRFAFSNNVVLDLNFEDYVIAPKDRQSEFSSFITIRPNPDDQDPDRPAWIFGDDFLRRWCLTLVLNDGVPIIGFSTNVWTPTTPQNSNTRSILDSLVFIFFPFVAQLI